jgi:hypothetical protein
MQVRNYVGLSPESVRIFVAVDTAGERWQAEFARLDEIPPWRLIKLRRALRNEKLAWDEYEAAVEAMKTYCKEKDDDTSHSHRHRR